MAPLLVPLVGALLVLFSPVPSRAGIDPAAAALRNVNAAKRNLARERREVKRAEKEVAKVKRDPEADKEDLREARAELKQERKELKAAAVAYKKAEERYQAFNQGAVSDPDLYETVVALTTPPPEQAAEPPPTSSSLPELGEGREMTEADLGESAALASGPASLGAKGRDARVGANALAAAGPRPSAGGSEFGGFASDLDSRALAAPSAHITQDGARRPAAAASAADGRPLGPHRALEAGRRGEAHNAAGRAPRLDPEAAAEHLAKSQDLARRGAWAGAEREAMEAIRRDPQNGAAHRALAWSQLHLGKFKEAEQAASRALALNPRDAEAYALRAFALEHQGQREAMLADLRRAALLDPRRFKRLLERAEKGLGVFDPNDKESWRLLEGVPEAPAGGRGWGGAAAGAAALLAVALLALRRRMRTGAAPASAAADEGGGLVGGKYELQGKIDGSAAVWEARDVSLGRSAALKKVELPAGAGAGPRREAAIQEAKTLAGLRHPNIVDIYEVLDGPAGFYLVFENLKGKTLRQILDEEGRLPWARLKAVLQPVCAALEFAHERGVAHRDLKASSVRVSAEGGVKIVDFAVAGSLAEGGQADDVRALGALAYEALTGERPLSPGPGSAQRAVLRLRELAPEMPAEAAQEVAAVFETDASKRPQSARSFGLAG